MLRVKEKRRHVLNFQKIIKFMNERHRKFKPKFKCSIIYKKLMSQLYIWSNSFQNGTAYHKIIGKPSIGEAQKIKNTTQPYTK